MTWSGNLLRLVYNRIVHEIPYPPQAQSQVPTASEKEIPSPPAKTGDKLDDDLELDIENHWEFINFEAQLPLIFDKVYDLESRHPSHGKLGQGKVEEQLRLINTEVIIPLP